MDFHDKFVNRFQVLSKESCCPQGEGLIIILRASKGKCFGKYDAVTLTMPYLNVLHDMAQLNSYVSFHKQPSCTKNVFAEH